jgi:hypothetical protein
MRFERLERWEVVGIVSGAVLILSLLFLPWYSLGENPARAEGEGFVCGAGDFDCTGFETFPILRWLLIAGALAPLILTYILLRGHRLSWPPGEMTMLVGIIAFALIGYNGIIDRPGSGTAEIGVELDLGYWIALLASIGIAVAGWLRSLEGQERTRKAPGTV